MRAGMRKRTCTRMRVQLRARARVAILASAILVRVRLRANEAGVVRGPQNVEARVQQPPPALRRGVCPTLVGTRWHLEAPCAMRE